jgi:tetratricopeptide (TPR) repeat protein
MIQRRNCLATACAVVLLLCVFGGAPRLFSQEGKDDLIQQIGWEIDNGRLDAALVHAQEGVAEYPGSSILMHLLGVAQSKKGMQKEARKTFQSAIHLDPTIPQNYYDLAVLDMQANNYGEAMGMLETYVRVNPQNGKAHLLLGLAYQKQKLDRPALEQFKKAVELSPDLPLAHYYLGTAYEDENNPKAALDEFKKELSNNPQFYDIYWRAGDIELEQNDLKAAEDYFRRGIALRPLRYEAHFGLAKALDERQELPQAAAELEMVIAIEPQDIEAHSLLARVYEKMGKTIEAKREDLAAETLRAESGAEQSADSQH